MNKYGIGRRVGLEQAQNIAEAIWAQQHLLRDEIGMEREGALTRLIQQETGRLIRGDRNLNLIRDRLYDM